MDDKYLDLVEAIRDGDDEGGVDAAKELIEGGTNPLDIFTVCVEPTLTEMGEEFSRLDLFLPDLIMAGAVVKELQAYLLPIMAERNIQGQVKGKAIIATVFGDMHDIGKNMVGLMMQINGFDMCDMGVDVSPMAIVKKAEELNADIVALSGLMMPSLPYMSETIELIKNNAKLKDHVKIMVGGGPVTEEWATKHGADGYSDDALSAVKLAHRLMGETA